MIYKSLVNIKEHDSHLPEAMKNTRRSGIKLNARECIMKLEECQYFEMIYTHNRIKQNLEINCNQYQNVIIKRQARTS